MGKEIFVTERDLAAIESWESDGGMVIEVEYVVIADQRRESDSTPPAAATA